MMLLSGQKDWATRLKHAGGAKGLVEKVIVVLEQSLDTPGFDETLLESLKPDLDLLISISEDLAEAMKSRSHRYEEAREQAFLAIGNCNAEIRKLQTTMVAVKANAERGKAAAADCLAKLQELNAQTRENDRKIAEVQENMARLATWWWVPGYNWYVLGKALDDLVNARKSHLEERLREASKEWRSTEESRRSMEALADELTNQARVIQSKADALEESRMAFEKSSEVYGRKVAYFCDAVIYYGLVRNNIEDVKDNLDLHMTVKRLFESTELVTIGGVVRQETLKGLLIHLGGECDQYLEDQGLVEAKNMSFKLFYIHDPLPPEYRLATVELVTAHRDALFTAMPNWEIANLADGSVDGQLYGGSVRLETRNDVVHKLAVKI